VRRCPEVAKTKDVDGWLPLHFACQFTAPLEVIQFLVEQWPEAVKKTTVNGSLPLHLLCSNNAPLEVVQFLVEQWPEAVMATKDGWLPLHCTCDNVCFYKEPLNVIQFLVEQWPEAVKKSTVNGSLPLHYACSNKAPLEVIQYLVEQWQEAVKKINTSGLTPLNQETRPEVVAWLQDVESGRIAFAVPLKQPPTSTPSKPEPEPKFEHDIASKLTMLDCYDSLVFLFTQIAYMRDLDSLVLCAVYRVVVCEFLSHVHCCLCRFLCLPETVSGSQEKRDRNSGATASSMH
jgi:hypothetical protein